MAHSDLIRLRGITWNHSRGYLPMVATAQRFSETHPGVEVVWEKRTLQEFGDSPVEKLVELFDLLVIDHPFVGAAARSRVFLPLDEGLGSDFLSEQHRNSVGQSHCSYAYDGLQWALAIDAAAPVSSWRPDLVAERRVVLPETWDELLKLAKRGLVAFPSIPVDSLMNFYMLCCGLGDGPFSTPDSVVDATIGVEALAKLRELVSLCRPEILTWNPIATYEAMTKSDEVLYCPFAFGYCNYARSGYARVPLEFGDLCRIEGNERLRTTLGGTGLAISAACRNREVALEYAVYVASLECQQTTYFQSGGQPGHRAAWNDKETNHMSRNFFRNTLPVLDRAYMRPRYAGYVHFQDEASSIIHGFLRENISPHKVVEQLQRTYEKSREDVGPGSLRG